MLLNSIRTQESCHQATVWSTSYKAHVFLEVSRMLLEQEVCSGNIRDNLLNAAKETSLLALFKVM